MVMRVLQAIRVERCPVVRLRRKRKRLAAVHEELLRQFDAGRQTAVEWRIEVLLRAPATV